MIKLIASDIDGTLLPEGHDKLNPQLFDVILRLKEKGILFAAASGRQYSSMRRLFEPVANEMIFICENGSNVICRGYEMSSTVLNRKDAEELVRYMRSLKGCCLTASTKESMYVEDQDEDFLRLLRDGYHNDIRVVPDVLSEPIDIIKTSIYKKDGVKDIAEEVIRRWKGKFNTVVAGEPWIDFMDYQADKGNALKKIQETLHIQKEETMAFGDNDNDIGMIRAAGESYAVANAREGVKKAARHLADENIHDGVLKVLKGLLEKLEEKQDAGIQ